MSMRFQVSRPYTGQGRRGRGMDEDTLTQHVIHTARSIASIEITQNCFGKTRIWLSSLARALVSPCGQIILFYKNKISQKKQWSVQHQHCHCWRLQSTMYKLIQRLFGMPWYRPRPRQIILFFEKVKFHKKLAIKAA